MALVDVLPLFKTKPLEIREPQSRLVPKNSITPIDVGKPTVALPLDQTLAPAPKSSPIFASPLAGKYESYNPLDIALQDSSIRDPRARAAVISQMGLERAWKIPEDNNYGNIISGGVWKGKTNKRGDHDAEGKPITQDFRTYDSPTHFVNDYVSLLKKQYPVAYNELFSGNFNIDRFTNGLVDGKFKYAQDPNYKQKVKSVYNDVATHISRNKQ